MNDNIQVAAFIVGTMTPGVFMALLFISDNLGRIAKALEVLAGLK